MSSIIVTGAHGFIGWHVVHALLDAGHEVRCVDKKPHPEVWSKGFFVDILDVPKLEDVFKKVSPDAVIHLAAQPSIQESWKAADRDAKVNILGTINLLGLCQRYNVKRFVFASTSAVYLPNHSGVYDELCSASPQTPYGISKMAAERYIMISDISYAILRLGNVYGPRQVPLGENQLIPRYLSHCFLGTEFVINGDGKQSRDFVYVKDVADAFVKVVESDEWGIFNIGSGIAHSVNHVVGTLWKIANYPAMYYPKNLCSIVQYGPAKKGELQNVTLDNVLAKHVFNWKPEVGIIEGLRETVRAWPK